MNVTILIIMDGCLPSAYFIVGKPVDKVHDGITNTSGAILLVAQVYTRR